MGLPNAGGIPHLVVGEGDVAAVSDMPGHVAAAKSARGSEPWPQASAHPQDRGYVRRSD